MFQCEDTGGAAGHGGDCGPPLNAPFNFLGLLFKHTFTLKIGSNCTTEVQYYFSECPAKAHFAHLFDTCPSSFAKMFYIMMLPPRGQ